MALEFRRRRFYRIGKKGQLVLAVATLLLTLCTAILWMLVNFHADRSPSPNESDNGNVPMIEEFSQHDTTSILLIFDLENTERFVLIQADPANGVLRTASVPSILSVDEERTLADVYRKSGAGAATAAVSQITELAFRHHIAITGENAETWFNSLGNGVSVTLPETVEIADANGGSLRLEKGEHTLTGTQAVLLLRGIDRNRSLTEGFAAELLAAMFNQFFTTDRYLDSDFSQIANLSKTSLHIGDFNDYRPVLEYLSSENDGSICEVIQLYGEILDGRFTFDKKQTAKNTALYK